MINRVVMKREMLIKMQKKTPGMQKLCIFFERVDGHFGLWFASWRWQILTYKRSISIVSMTDVPQAYLWSPLAQRAEPIQIWHFFTTARWGIFFSERSVYFNQLMVFFFSIWVFNRELYEAKWNIFISNRVQQVSVRYASKQHNGICRNWNSLNH